jgi:hypothetical protein
MTYQPIDISRFAANAHGAGWIPTTMRDNLEALLRGRGVACAWGQHLHVVPGPTTVPPLEPVSAPPDAPMAWPVLMPASGRSRTLRMQLDAESLGAGVEVALWCAGRQTDWGDPTDLFELELEPQGRGAIACVVFRSKVGSPAVSVNVRSDTPSQVERVGGPQLAHHLVSYEGDELPCRVWWYSTGLRVWPRAAAEASSSTPATATPLGTMRVRGGCIWWHDASTDGLPVPDDVAGGRFVRSQNVRQLGGMADFLHSTRPEVATCGPTRDTPAGITSPLALPSFRQWTTTVRPGEGEAVVAACQSGLTTSRATFVTLATALEAGAQVRVYAGSALVAGPIAIAPTPAGQIRGVPSDSGTTYRVLSRPAAIHAGLHIAGQEDARRLDVTTIAIARGLIDEDETIWVTVEGGPGIVATCTIEQDRADVQRVEWDVPAVQPLTPVLGDTLALIDGNADNLLTGLRRVVLSRWVDRAPVAGDEWRGVLPASTPGAAFGLQVAVRAANCVIEVEADDGVSPVTDTHTFGSASTHVFALAITPGTVYILTVRVNSTSGSPLVVWIRAEEA